MLMATAWGGHLILLASFAAIANCFTCFQCRTVVSHSPFQASKRAPSHMIVLQCVSRDDITNMNCVVEGYEYLHPEIAAMLVTKGRKIDDTNKQNLFEVDTTTLTIRRKAAVHDGSYGKSTTDAMPLDMLAGIAEACDQVVFSAEHGDDGPISSKILGLISLSENPEIWREDIADEDAAEMRQPAILVASMVALNLLESSIRSVVMVFRHRKIKRGAPLLSSMIQEMAHLDSTTQDAISPADLVPMLKAFLLPTRTGGINLRNLVSHGFLATIERRWLSLTLVLIHTLDTITVDGNAPRNVDASASAHVATSEGNDQQHVTPPLLTKYESLAREVDYGKNALICGLRDLELHSHTIVPRSHMPLMKFTLHYLAPTLRPSLACSTAVDEEFDADHNQDPFAAYPVPSLTAIFITIMCALLEHSLRLAWCEANNRPEDRFARPSQYYVTLDGHGQRDRHEVLLTPYLSDGSRNNIIDIIGPESLAMLGDLFAAPALEAPNIRSSVCHGTWDDEIVKELNAIAAITRKRPYSAAKSDRALVETACALVSCLDMICKRPRRTLYRPVYTYTATALRTLNDILADLDELEALTSSNPSVEKCIRTLGNQRPTLHGALRPFVLELDMVEKMAYDLFPMMKKPIDEAWAANDTFIEHHTNTVLARNVVALTLMSDAAFAIRRYLHTMKEKIRALTSQHGSAKEKRALKTATRFCSVAGVARDFYTFAAYVPLVTIKNDMSTAQDAVIDRDDAVKASERSRMAISTFDSYVSTDIDRSIRAVEQYTRGKVVRKLIPSFEA